MNNQISGNVFAVANGFIVQVLLIFLEFEESLIWVLWATPYPSMGRILVLNPVLASIVQLVRGSAVFVCTYVRAQITYEMSPVVAISVVSFMVISIPGCLTPMLFGLEVLSSIM